MTKSEYVYHRVVIGLLLLILVVPLLATLLYALATEWGATILPDGLTIEWFSQLWHDPRFLAALGRSLVICFGALAFSFVLVLP